MRNSQKEHLDVFLQSSEEKSRVGVTYSELFRDIVFEIASTNDTRGTANDGSLNNLHDYG